MFKSIYNRSDDLEHISVYIYILLDILLCSITEYFYELCRILSSLKYKSKYKWVKKSQWYYTKNVL